MEIKLVKTEVVDFKLNEVKCKEFDLVDILYFAGVDDKPYKGEDGPRYVAFKTRDEFIANFDNYDIDRTKKILINDKGNFFCPLKSTVTISESKEVVDEPANTEENQAE